MTGTLKFKLASDARFTRRLTGNRPIVTVPTMTVWAQLVRFWNWTI